MQNAIKLENISNLITSPSSYQCRKTTVNMKVSGTVNMKVSDTVNMKVDFVITCISIITDFHSKYMLGFSY
jgi:hypothetical protein